MKSKFMLFLTVSMMAMSTTAIVGCTSKYQQESTGQYIDSSVITTKVKTKLLADKLLPGTAINVTTYKNIVQLSGFVKNAYQKRRAVNIAKQVPGVVEVKDAIEIKH